MSCAVLNWFKSRDGLEMIVLGVLVRVQQAPGICVDKFGEVDTTLGHVQAKSLLRSCAIGTWEIW